MSNIDNIINETLAHEGGYSDRSADRGGPTMYGITQDTLSAWLGRPASIDDVKNLSLSEAKEIYEKNYLSDPRINTLSDPPMELVFDMSINHGAKTAIMILQRTINLAEFGPIDVDGVLGPQCRAAAQAAQDRMGNYFQNAIVEERIKFYQALVAAHPDQETFLNGWTSRANSYLLPV